MLEDIFKRFRNQPLLKLAVTSFITFLLLVGFVFDLKRVNGYDMQDTLEFGSVVGINKWRTHFKVGELILFYPQLSDTVEATDYFIQRVCGAPGDSVRISNKLLFVNGHAEPALKTFRYNYFVTLKKGVSDSLLTQQYLLREGGRVSESGADYCYAMTTGLADSLRKDTLVASVNLRVEKAGAHDPTAFPGVVAYRWNKDWYGPLVIPKKDQALVLDTTTIKLYGKLLLLESHRWRIGHDTIYVDDVATRSYTVKNDYYFVLGDDRDNANDSRSWGFLPAWRIKGSVTVLYTKGRR